MTRRSLRALQALLLASGVALAVAACGPAETEAPPAYEIASLPEGLDTLTTLEELGRRVAACTGDCVEVVYLWSPRMPLSRSGIPNVHQAVRRVGAGLTVVGFEDVERFARSETPASGATGEAVEAMLEAGALSHAPALVVYRGGNVAGPAVMGYKTAEAYEWMLARRLADEPAEAAAQPRLSQAPDRVTPGSGTEPTVAAASLARREPEDVGAASAPGTVREAAYRDWEAIGVPGAYFRWVPGTRSVAYESGRRIYLLDLTDGTNLVAPGFIDFVPTPDGRYFVTPSPRNDGLAFFDAEEVLDASARGQAGDVRPIFTDGRMRDQYPSVGILASDASSVLYRVLTSWFEGVVYRDYEVVHGTEGAPASVRPLGAPVVPCEGVELSTPIMSQNGSELAARDEATGTTKIFRFLAGGRCEQVLDLGVPTRKVAWHASGTKLAFSTPRVRSAGADGFEPGILVYDRDTEAPSHIADSEAASQLAFPDFVGEDAIVFMMPARTRGEPSVFRLVEPLP